MGTDSFGLGYVETCTGNAIQVTRRETKSGPIDSRRRDIGRRGPPAPPPSYHERTPFDYCMSLSTPVMSEAPTEADDATRDQPAPDDDPPRPAAGMGSTAGFSPQARPRAAGGRLRGVVQAVLRNGGCAACSHWRP